MPREDEDEEEAVMEEMQDTVADQPMDSEVHDGHQVPEGPTEAPSDEAPLDTEESGGDDSRARIERIVESVLFAAGSPVALRKLVDILGATGPRPTVKEVQAAVVVLQDRYAAGQRGIRLHEVAGGYQFRTARENAEWVRQLFREKPARLGRATLETLAIVAYKQPVTKADIEAVRGVDVDGVLNTLLGRKLIKIAGRKEAVGRPLLYETTPEFLETFGLKDVHELPTLNELGPITDAEDPASPPPEDGLTAAAEGATADETPELATQPTDGSAEFATEPADDSDEFTADPADDSPEQSAAVVAEVDAYFAEADAAADDASAGAWPATDESAADASAAADPAAASAEWSAADRAAPEDSEPSGSCLEAGGGDDDHGGTGSGEREDGDGTGGEGGPPSGPDHR